MTKEQLLGYLRDCADRADKCGGHQLAHVHSECLRQAIALLMLTPTELRPASKRYERSGK